MRSSICTSGRHSHVCESATSLSPSCQIGIFSFATGSKIIHLGSSATHVINLGMILFPHQSSIPKCSSKSHGWNNTKDWAPPGMNFFMNKKVIMNHRKTCLWAKTNLLNCSLLNKLWLGFLGMNLSLFTSLLELMQF